MQTRKQIRSLLPSLVGVLAVVLFAGCFADAPPGGARPHGSGGSSSPDELGGAGDMALGGSGGLDGDPMSDAGATGTEGKCLPVDGEPLFQRSSILSNAVAPTELEIPITDIYSKFKVQCGACHHEQALGGFQVLDKGFGVALQNPKILELIQSDDRTRAMPSLPAVPYSKLPEGDALRTLVKLLTEWKGAGYPQDVFYEKLPAGAGQSPYALSTAQGMAFTNIGTCVPMPSFPYASDAGTMKRLDDDFASRKHAADDIAAPEDKIGLPADLADTDLTSFDSAVLARRGVIAFAPAYPLWSDDAGKLRYVRVPLGQSITFDAKTQSFHIPENTRFYKTFMKEVTDASGQKRWRKLETRLILARHDVGSPQDAGYQPQSLFGSYEWDETETRAKLLIDTLRNGDPFADHLFEYVVDEPKAAEVRASKPPNLTYALERANVARHWAVPGSQRCIHCHEGSLNDNFILGFTPLQINRRKLGEGGVYEAPTVDELGQLQRLIDLGVITGLNSADEIRKLEDSQADPIDSIPDRKPRNDQELKAQGYMLANCSHCHNQHGFPSVAAKELTNVLNFYPGKRASETVMGGIFQFPLELASPRIARGWDHEGIAYITPSLRDAAPPSESAYSTPSNYAPKELQDSEDTMNYPYRNVPWRSLIYRNVKTAFTYADGGTLYPHMPFDTGGHDCRASQWLGEWMVSIPAVRKNPDLSELCSVERCDDDTPQPYVEVHLGDAGYDAAVAVAKARLKTYMSDDEYKTCPDNGDIVDPDVLGGYRDTPADKTGDGMPDHANWVVTDLTERKGLWAPRREDWQAVLVDHVFPPASSKDLGGAELAKQKVIVDQLGTRKLTEVAEFANSKFPLALWQNKPGCKFDSVPKVKSFGGAQRPAWFDWTNADPEAPVFAVRPGQAIFDMICINCHGPNADSLGRQADTLQNMTGGTARVANFRFGLFNPGSFDDPYDNPDLGSLTNRQRVFGAVANGGLSVDDWGARYLAWMALGGTSIAIPPVILQQVAATGVAGVNRAGPVVSGQLSANMLQVAQGACRVALGAIDGGGQRIDITGNGRVVDDHNPLISKNGDMELWLRLCAIDNPQMVRTLSLFWQDSAEGAKVTAIQNAYPAPVCDEQGLPDHCFPSNAPVGNERGEVVPSLRADNVFAWCLNPGDLTPTQLSEYLAAHPLNGSPLPLCPADWYANRPSDEDALKLTSAWANHGAINAGFLVFDFLDAYINPKPGQTIKHLGYDQCDLLPAAQ